MRKISEIIVGLGVQSKKADRSKSPVTGDDVSLLGLGITMLGSAGAGVYSFGKRRK